MTAIPTAGRRRALGELDRLVLTELASFQRAHDRQRGAARVRRADEEIATAATDGLTAAGAAFVERTMEWLERRADREALMTALWTRLQAERSALPPEPAEGTADEPTPIAIAADVPDATGG